jgi:hypothetical protein
MVGERRFRRRIAIKIEDIWTVSGRRCSGYGVLVVQSPPVFFRCSASREATAGDQRVGWGAVREVTAAFLGCHL